MTSCPSDDELLALREEQVAVARARALEAHLGECGECRSRASRLEVTLAAIASPAPGVSSDASPDTAAFVARTMARLDPSPAAATRASWLPYALAATVLAVTVPLCVYLWRHTGGRAETFQARGGGPTAESLKELTGVELYAAKRHGAPRRLNAHDLLAADEGLAVEVSRLTPTPLYLLVFVVEAGGEVHWAAPRWDDPAKAPLALDLPRGRRVMLHEVFAPDAKPGLLRAVSVVSRQRRSVKQVEALLRDAGKAPSLARLFPEAHVQEWSLTLRGAR